VTHEFYNFLIVNYAIKQLCAQTDAGWSDAPIFFKKREEIQQIYRRSRLEEEWRMRRRSA
jgi:hypothetical protein